MDGAKRLRARPARGEMEGFGSVAAQLSKNPLGIIALFIVLVYAIAALVVSVESIHGENQFWPILIGMVFIALFPAIVLVVFYLLVTRHHMKLYDPSQIITNPQLVDAWIENGRFRQAMTTEIKAEKAAAISQLQRVGDKSAADPTRLKTTFYVGEWTSRRMAADRSVFREARKRGLAGFENTMTDPRRRYAISRVLDFLEELCGDINLGVVDKGIIYPVMGDSLRRAWEKSKDFILSQRAERNDSLFMSDLERVYNSFPDLQLASK